MNDKEILESGQKVLDFLRNKEYVDVRFTGKIISEINCRNGGVSDVKVSPTLVFRENNDIPDAEKIFPNNYKGLIGQKGT